MPVFFQSMLSGSSGNCLMLWSEHTRLMIDAGARSQKALRAILDGCVEEPPLSAVLISHLHGDHVNYSSLSVFAQTGHRVFIHRDNRRQLMMKHAKGKPFAELKLVEFGNGPFTVGEFTIENFEVEHDGNSRNCGFVVKWQEGERVRKAVAATDFHEWSAVADHFIDADFLYLEANYDPEMLRIYPNPNSHFHLSNVKTGRLLARTLAQSRHLPQTVVLGHLSAERNQPELALSTVREMIMRDTAAPQIDLHVAPRYGPSPIFAIAGT